MKSTRVKSTAVAVMQSNSRAVDSIHLTVIQSSGKSLMKSTAFAVINEE